jgi:hypothetical protein
MVASEDPAGYFRGFTECRPAISEDAETVYKRAQAGGNAKPCETSLRISARDAATCSEDDNRHHDRGSDKRPHFVPGTLPTQL